MPTYCFTSALCDELVEQVLSHLNAFDRVRFALTSKRNAARFLCADAVAEVRADISRRRRIMSECMRVVRRINTDGVVYGECLDCGTEALLYTRFDGVEERTVCLETCKYRCAECGHTSVRRGGRAPPARCQACSNDTYVFSPYTPPR